MFLCEKINLHESVFKHTTHIEWKEREKYHSVVRECSLSLIDRKASNAQKCAFKKKKKTGLPQTK